MNSQTLDWHWVQGKAASPVMTYKDALNLSVIYTAWKCGDSEAWDSLQAQLDSGRAWSESGLCFYVVDVLSFSFNRCYDTDKARFSPAAEGIWKQWLSRGNIHFTRLHLTLPHDHSLTQAVIRLLLRVLGIPAAFCLSVSGLFSILRFFFVTFLFLYLVFPWLQQDITVSFSSKMFGDLITEISEN